MKSVYRITAPSGESEEIIAETRNDAIDEYCCRHGCTRAFVAWYCTVKRLGVE